MRERKHKGGKKGETDETPVSLSTQAHPTTQHSTLKRLMDPETGNIPTLSWMKAEGEEEMREDEERKDAKGKRRKGGEVA